MAVSDLFVAQAGQGAPRQYGQAGPTGTQGQNGGGSVGVFLTPKSLTTFPTASLAVYIISALSRYLYPVLEKNRWVPVVAALLVGSFIFLISVNDSRVKPKTTSDWLVSGGVAFINALYLAAVASKLL